MSQSEKDAVIGKAVREEKELRIGLAAQDKQLEDIAEDLNELRERIRARIHRFHPDLTDLPIPPELGQYGLARLADLVRDRRSAYDKLKAAEDLLVRLGIRSAPTC